MNVLIFNWRDIEHPWAGGSEVNVHEMAKRWITLGHTVTMVCAHHYGNSLSREKKVIDGIKHIRLGGRFSIYFLAPLYYFFRLRNQYDVILDIENGIPFFTPLFVRKPICCLINHIHKDVFFIEMPFPLNFIGYILETKLMPFIYRNISFVVISRTTRKSLMSLGIKDDHISLVYAGLDHHEYKPGKEKFNKPTLLYVGRLRKYKRIGLLVDIAMRLLPKFPDLQLFIIGDGDDKVKLMRKVSDLGTKNIQILGFASNKKKIEFLQRSWVFVTTSMVEGWGLSVIEANACGSPAVAFRAPGLSDAIMNNYSGLLVSDTEQMIHGISSLIKNTALRKKISSHAILYASNFTWEKSSRNLLKIIEKLYDQSKRV